MKAVIFPGANDKFGKDLPAYKNKKDQLGQVVTCYKLSFFEWLFLPFKGRRIYSSVVTQNDSLQPQRITAHNPVPEIEKEIDYLKDKKLRRV